MKKLFAIAAALLGSLLIGVTAGAADLSDYYSEYDDVLGGYFYYDDYGTLVAIEWDDGEVVRMDEDYDNETTDDPYYEDDDYSSDEPIDDYYPYEPIDYETFETVEEILYPEIMDVAVTDKTATITTELDKNWDVVNYSVYRSESGSDEETLVGTYGISPDCGDAYVYEVIFEDSGLKGDTEYSYRIIFLDNLGRQLCSVECTIRTEQPLYDPELLEPTAYSDKITIKAVIDERWKADGFVVQRYSSKSKKWADVYESERLEYYDWSGNYSQLLASYTDEKLKSAKKYNYKIKFFRYTDEDKKEREYFGTLKQSAYTLLKAPELTLGATSKKTNLSWSKVSGADGYEIYVYTQKPGEYDYGGWYDPYGWYGWYGWGDYGEGTTSLDRYNTSYLSRTVYPIDIGKFKEYAKIKGGSKTSASYSIKNGKIYVYRVRGYKKVGGKKIYSEFSNQASTDSTEALLNGLKLDPKVTVNDTDLALIKKALKKCVNSDMSNAEKAAAVYDYVHNAAKYEYDFSLIPTDPIEAILSAGRGQCYQFAVTYQAMMKYLGFDVKLVSGKTSSGGGHWWCELNCAGTAYMIDPQVGGRFLIRYDQMGSLAVTKEKVYD